MPSRPAKSSSSQQLWARITSLAGVGVLCFVGGSTCGCQATIGGQTLPSAYYLQDDVQYFPAGPEFLLPNQRRALEEYRAQQEGFDAELESTFN